MKCNKNKQFFKFNIPNMLNTYALRALSPAVVSIYIYLQPFIATLIAIYYYHNDEPDARKIVSALLIIIGVYLVSWPFRKVKPKES
jgi:drug/metabolite transporter (DMT)-like permease